VVREKKSYLILIIVVRKWVRWSVVVLPKEGLHTLGGLGVCMERFQRTSAVSTTYHPIIPIYIREGRGIPIYGGLVIGRGGCRKDNYKINACFTFPLILL
jgi:hypothetical protein